MSERNANFSFAESGAEELLERFKINDVPVPVNAIAENLGFKVLIAKFNDDAIAGYVTLAPSMQIIVSQSDAPTRRAFTLAHEIGHFILHRTELENDEKMAVLYRKPIGGETDPIEKEANAFAASLLVPVSLLAKYHSYEVSDFQLASIFGVSSEVMRYRLRRTGYR